MADKIELRWESDRFVVSMLDAVSGSRSMSRTSLAEKVLMDWAVRQFREANAIQRVTRGNPVPPEAAGSMSEMDGKL